MDIKRPIRHFTPPQGWMNDPNGLVWFDGEYHLFYQHHPAICVWGPMHWGHAVSTDLVSWTHLPVALAPDAAGTIFSGSVVVDQANTAGFAKPGETALVALYTLHDPTGKRAGTGRHESQCLAYSVDRGRNWTKYSGNPVLPNPGARPDFRDPKVFWHAPTARWIMALAAGDEIVFYWSPDLKDWHVLSQFGKALGAHGGVWECPDLMEVSFDDTGATRWVLFVSLNPGGVQGGSGTQYFYGDFDGESFTPSPDCLEQIAQYGALWLDFGPDHYAAVSFSNLPDAEAGPVILGWMNNWHYGQSVPEAGWRGTMALPRTLSLVRVKDGYRLASRPLSIHPLLDQPASDGAAGVRLDRPDTDIHLSLKAVSPQAGFRMIFSGPGAADLVFEFDGATERYTVRRALPDGLTIDGFTHTIFAPRLTAADRLQLSVHLDHGSIEIFADEGLTPITVTHFLGGAFDRVALTVSQARIEKFSVSPVEKLASDTIRTAARIG